MTLLLAAAISHVLIIGVDGLSAEGVRTAPTPNIHKLMDSGAWTLRSRGVMPTVSSPNWMSLLSGAGPEMHGVHSNEWERFNFKIAPACQGPESIFPGLFSVIKQQRPNAKLAAIHDWQGFGRLVEKGSAHHVQHVKGSAATVDAALAYWREHKPLLLFVHLDDVDHAGHDKTWEGPEYKAAVTEIDRLIGKLLGAWHPGKTLVVLVADHGGTSTKHGSDTTAELEVPLIFSGPGIAKGELTNRPRNIDMAPTVIKALGLKPHPCWEGTALR